MSLKAPLRARRHYERGAGASTQEKPASVRFLRFFFPKVAQRFAWETFYTGPFDATNPAEMHSRDRDAFTIGYGLI
jgi:hypothetical protein